ncbi:MAG: hypothetical protein IJ865_04485, partial [Clostridia bacterium]|nr:hypothetical protein [Clostridia bacterium]
MFRRTLLPLLIALCLLLTDLFPAALAEEDWELTQITLLWADDEGNALSAQALPLPGSAPHTFIASLPE